MRVELLHIEIPSAFSRFLNNIPAYEVPIHEHLFPLQTLILELLRETVAAALGTLLPRDAEVVAMRFGINGAEYEHTLEEIARRFGVTRERIRQIEGRALDRLRFRLTDE